MEFIPKYGCGQQTQGVGERHSPAIWITKNLEGDGDFITHCDSPMEDDSLPIINILELFKQAVFFDANKTCDSDEM